MDDWPDLERLRNQAPKEESPLKGFKTLIVLLIMAALAFYLIYRMGQLRLVEMGTTGRALGGLELVERPDPSANRLFEGGGLTADGGSQHKV
jgi:hypothetical protein